MSEIPELKNDYAFLKKFDARNIWKEFNNKKRNKKKNVTANFLLHPKRLSSDSSDSLSGLNSPKELLSNTTIKNSSSFEFNDNNVRVEENCRLINIIEDFTDETALPNTKSVTISKVSTVTMNTKKSNRNRLNSSSMRIENFDKKFTNLVEKSLKLLTGIKDIMEKGIPPPDGEEDFARRMKRLQEFSARFSRNYLYPLLRLMDELSAADKMGSVVVNQKLLYAQQVVLQGLQAYYNHLPSSVGKCGSDKLKSLVDQAVYLCQIYGILKSDGNGDNNEFVNIMRTQSELLLQTISTFDLKILEKSRKCVSNTVTNKNKLNKPQNKQKSKLSMYAVTASFRKDLEWRKTVEALAKKKFNVKSKYKTATFKHRPPVEKSSVATAASRSKLFTRRPDGFFRTTPMKSPIREDDIKTMIEMEGDIAAPPNSGELLNHENSIASSQQQLVRDSDCGMMHDDSDNGNVEKALEVLRKFLGENQAQFLEKITTTVTDKEKTRQFKEPLVTVTGAKNAKLICIRDENSVIEDDNKKDKEIMTDVEIELKSSQTQTDLRQEIRNRICSRSAIKISRLPKSSKKLLKVLPKDYAINIIQYKLRYNHFHKRNPMYRKSANLQPWVLMGRISDDILDHILQSVTGELEVNEILENLYNAEFQY